jgi:hypothetical protein
MHAINGFGCKVIVRVTDILITIAHKAVNHPFTSCKKLLDGLMHYTFISRIFYRFAAAGGYLPAICKRELQPFGDETKGNESSNVT